MRITSPLARWSPWIILLVMGFAIPGHAQKGDAHPNLDVRMNRSTAPAKAANLTGARTAARTISGAVAQLKARVPGAEVKLSEVTGGVEVVGAARSLTAAAPGRAGFEIVKDFLQTNAALYGLAPADIASLHFIGESVSRASGLRMVRVEQMVQGRPVFQSETRFTIDRDGRLVRSVGLMVPNATAIAAAPANAVSAPDALVSAMSSVGIALDSARMTVANKSEVNTGDARIQRPVKSELVWFPTAPGVLVPAWSQVSMTSGDGDWFTLVDANTGALLWRKNIRSHVSTQDARFSVYVQPDGVTPADSPSPLSPTNVAPGAGTQTPEIARTTVNMFSAQSGVASPNGWIADGGNTTTGNNVDAYLDRDGNDGPDTGLLDANGRPVGNLDASSRNRDFLGTNFDYTPPPVGGNADSGTAPTDAQFQRGAITQLFYIANWYHDQLHALGFDEAAGNFQTTNFSGMGLGGDPVLAEAQDEAGKVANGNNRNNANFSTPPDGQSGRMQMYLFDGPSPNRDGALDAEVVMHELTHGVSNRLIGNGSGLNWHVGAGMGEGWSDFYALSLLNRTNADNPNGRYAAGAYATYQLAGSTENYLYGIRRFPYCTDNSVTPLTWADVDDVTNNLGGGIPSSPINFNFAGGGEVHNIGEVWCNTLWEVRSRIIADPTGANGDVRIGGDRTLQIVTDAMKMTPIDPSFLDARDAIIAADAATNAGANERWIWEGFADRGLGYNAVAPFSRMFGYVSGHMGIGESSDVPYLDVQSVAVDDSLGNNNGAIDPGEPVRITVKLKNPWRGAAFDVPSATATLGASTAGVNITTASATYAAIPAQGNADGTQFRFNVPSNATAGQALRFTITPTSTLGTKAVNFTLRVGTPSGTGAPITYTHTPNLAIPDYSPRGIADTLTIPDDLVIADLDFRIGSLTHTFTGDLTVMLRGPNGLGTDLITAVGGLVSGGGAGHDFVNTVIDDQAAGDLLFADNAAAPFTGSWAPVFNLFSWVFAGFDPDPVGTLGRYNGLSTQGNWTVLVSDEGPTDLGTLNSWSLIITPVAYAVTPFNPPVLTPTSAALSYTENDASTTIDSALTVTDADSPNLTGGSVSITAGFANGQDVLGFTTQNGISGNYDANTGVLTLTGATTVANYQTALRSVTYANTSDNPSTATRTITFLASDGTLSGTATRDITITALNDPPDLDITGTTLSYVENQAPTPVDDAIVVTDPDSANLTGATISISANFAGAQDSLDFTTVGGITGSYDSGTGVLTLSGTASVADYQAALRSVTYFNASEDPSTFTRTVTIVCSDGIDSGSTSRQISVTSVNDSPALTVNSTAQSYTENGAPVAIDGSLLASDVDNANLVGASVAITAGFASGEDVLSFANQGPISGSYDGGTGVLTLSGTATLAQYRAALRSVTYANTSENPSSATRTITFTGDDGAAANRFGSASRALNVTPVNDAPVVTTTGAPLAYTENAGATLIDSALTLADVDNANLASATVSISTGHAAGEDVLGFANQGAISGGYNSGSGVLTLSGSATLAEYQAALRSVTYANTSDDPSTTTRSITFAVNDGGAAGSSSRSIVITAVNDPPTLTAIPNPAAILEDSGLQTINLTGIGTGGETQTLNVTAMSDNTALIPHPSVSYTSPSATGSLTFTPVSNAFGSANITVTVNDGGASNTTVQRMFTVTVTAVNDVPAFTAGADVVVAKDSGAYSQPWASGISAGPANENGQALDFIVSNDNATIFATAPTIAANGTLSFTPLAGVSGFANVTVRLHDNGGGGAATSGPQIFRLGIGTIENSVGAYNGLIRPTAGAPTEFGRLGFVSVKLTQRGAFTAKLALGAEKFSVKGAIDLFGESVFGRDKTATVPLPRTPLVLDLRFDTAFATDQLTGTLRMNNAAFAQLTADRALYTARRNPVAPMSNPPTELVANYTARFQALTPAAQGRPANTFPQGDGFGMTKVLKNGTARIAATLADGVKFSAGAPLAKDNTWPLHTLTAGKTVIVNGPVLFTTQPGVSDFVVRSLTWVKLSSNRTPAYLSGWPGGIGVDLLGSKYVRAKTDAAVPFLDANDGNASFEADGRTAALNIDSRGRVTQTGAGISGLKFKVSKKTGMISGQFPDATGAKLKFNGVIFDQQQLGSGFFLRNGKSEPVTLTPAP